MTLARITPVMLVIGDRGVVVVTVILDHVLDCLRLYCHRLLHLERLVVAVLQGDKLFLAALVDTVTTIGDLG
ncbi:unnamed protein product [Linum trigynum]|uniref:Secreted protein n=1 Tax=Linum trigynum TaxID=586398 RepID=A0AAV2F0Z3_9ROSI